jgi:hypothetical protein
MECRKSLGASLGQRRIGEGGENVRATNRKGNLAMRLTSPTVREALPNLGKTKLAP